MKEFIERNRDIFEGIIVNRKFIGLSIERVAADCGVTTQTVRNFESLTCINPILLVYYIELTDKMNNEHILGWKFKEN